MPKVTAKIGRLVNEKMMKDELQMHLNRISSEVGSKFELSMSIV